MGRAAQCPGQACSSRQDAAQGVSPQNQDRKLTVRLLFCSRLPLEPVLMCPRSLFLARPLKPCPSLEILLPERAC